MTYLAIIESNESASWKSPSSNRTGEICILKAERNQLGKCIDTDIAAYSECVRRKSRPHLLSRQTYGRYRTFEKVEIEDI